MKIVLDTNVFLVALPSHSKYYPIFKALLDKKYDLYLSNEIVTEYEEKLSERLGVIKTDLKLKELLNLKNVNCIEPYFNWQLIEVDKDDNKFVDCTVACNANFLVTNDRHFNILNQIPFPQITIIKAEDFLKIIS